MVEAYNPEVLISNLSLPKPLMFAGSTAAHERYLDCVGADGMELTPVNASRFMGKLLGRAAEVQAMAHDPDLDARYEQHYEDEAFTELVRAQHSSFRNDTGDDGVVARMVPTWRESLRQMSAVQNITGKLGAVLYTNFESGHVTYDDTTAPFAERTFQPKASEWHGMGLLENSSADEIAATLQNRGFTGITFDVFHCQVEDQGQRFKDPLAFATKLAADGLIRSVHLSLNRLDISGFRSDLAGSTSRAREAFVDSVQAAKNTLEGEMLQAIINEWRNNPLYANTKRPNVVLEDGPIRFGGVRWDHAAIIDNTRQLISA